MTPAPENLSPATSVSSQSASDAWLQRRRARIQRVKKWLRYIPRRANMHRYPVLKWFAAAARKRSYLWSFRTREVVPAIYLGWMVAMVPAPIHMGLVLILSFAIRSNLMVGWALVWVTNPVTIPFFLFINFHIGAEVLNRLGGMHVDIESFRDLAHAEHPFHFQGRNVGAMMKDVMEMMYALTVGGLLTGFAGGFVTSVFYRHFASKMRAEPPLPPTTP